MFVPAAQHDRSRLVDDATANDHDEEIVEVKVMVREVGLRRLVDSAGAYNKSL